MINRREFLELTTTAGAALALTPTLLGAGKPAAKLIQRTIPSSGEKLPVIGLGRGNDAVDPAAFREVLQTLLDHGGTVLDIQHGGAPAEQVTSTVANELGVQKKIFWSLRGSPPGPPQPAAAAKTYIDSLFAKFKVAKIDLLLVPAMADPALLEVLKEAKKEGRVRYIGVQAIADHQYAKLESIMRNEPVDFIGVDYAADDRGVEQTILPLAQERKIAVLAYFPMGGNIGPDGTVTSGLLRRAGTTPLPEWAADFDAKTWAQVFLKYVVSHPAVTAARTGTSQSKHMLDNIAAGTGRLPDDAARKRIAELVDSLPTP